MEIGQILYLFYYIWLYVQYHRHSIARSNIILEAERVCKYVRCKRNLIDVTRYDFKWCISSLFFSTPLLYYLLGFEINIFEYFVITLVNWRLPRSLLNWLSTIFNVNDVNKSMLLASTIWSEIFFAQKSYNLFFNISANCRAIARSITEELTIEIPVMQFKKSNEL